MGDVAEMGQGEPLVAVGKGRGAFNVSPVVNTKAYHDAFDAMPLPRLVRESAYIQSGRILSAANGTEHEHMSAIDERTGSLVVDNLEREPQDRRTGFNAVENLAVTEHGGRVVIIHNHPSGLQPSYRDIMTAALDERIASSIVVGHDGSVWHFAIDDPRIASRLESFYNRFADIYGESAEVKSVKELLALNDRHGLFEWRKLR